MDSYHYAFIDRYLDYCVKNYALLFIFPQFRGSRDLEVFKQCHGLTLEKPYCSGGLFLGGEECGVLVDLIYALSLLKNAGARTESMQHYRSATRKLATISSITLPRAELQLLAGIFAAQAGLEQRMLRHLEQSLQILTHIECQARNSTPTNLLLLEKAEFLIHTWLATRM